MTSHRKKELSTGDKIALLAFIVSIFSILFSIYQFRTQKADSERQFAEVRYNDSVQRENAMAGLRNSVAPLLVIEKWAALEANPLSGIQLKNEGPGPAMIDSSVVMFDNVPGDLGSVDVFANRLGLYCWTGQWQSLRIQKGMVIKSGGDEWLFSVPSRQIKINADSAFDSLISKHIRVVVYYHSLMKDSLKVIH